MKRVDFFTLCLAFSICFSRRKGGTLTIVRHIPVSRLFPMIALLCFRAMPVWIKYGYYYSVSLVPSRPKAAR